MTELILYTRAGCHLCDEMKAGLLALRSPRPFKLTEIEVGWEGALAEKYGQLVPLLEMAGEEVCHYFLDEERLKVALAAHIPGC